jgi:hypothetical protein
MAKHVDIFNLLKVIEQVHSQHADDLCWMDIDLIFKAAGLSVPDRRVGCKVAMKKNCERFIDTMCSEGVWKSYAELEVENEELRGQVAELLRVVGLQQGDG